MFYNKLQFQFFCVKFHVHFNVLLVKTPFFSLSTLLFNTILSVKPELLCILCQRHELKYMTNEKHKLKLFNTRKKKIKNYIDYLHETATPIISNMLCFAGWEWTLNKDEVKEHVQRERLAAVWKIPSPGRTLPTALRVAQSKSRNEQQMTLEEARTTPWAEKTTCWFPKILLLCLTPCSPTQEVIHDIRM